MCSRWWVRGDGRLDKALCVAQRYRSNHEATLVRITVDYARMMRDLILAMEGLAHALFVPRSRARDSEIDRLRRDVAALGEFSCDDSASASAWAANANELRNHVLNDDPNNFLQWT